jgi:xanthine dehydrogenase accessory factor
MTYSFPKLLEALAAGGDLALATVVQTDGSTPQVEGAAAIFSKAGLAAGTVGGGLLEARVAASAAKALADKEPRLVTVSLEADPADLEGAICGGTARVLVDPGVEASRGVFSSALEGFRRRRRGALVSRLVPGHGDTVAVERGWLPEGVPGLPGDPVFGELAPEIVAAVAEGGAPRLFVESKERMWFIEPVVPLPRLIVVGAGHVGRAVAQLGSLLDFSVTVIDDREEFANILNVPEANEIVRAEIGEAVRTVEDSPDNYFVIVTRGHEKDAEALRAVVGRPAAYVGMIGSRRKIELMECEFLENGWATAAQWAAVHAPIGLDIGSRTVEEIAVSIAAELVKVRAGRLGVAAP